MVSNLLKGSLLVRCIVVLLVLTLIPIGASTASASGGAVTARIVSYPVTINGVTVDNLKARYPLLQYKDITYFPMTWEYADTLGFITSWSQENGLSVHLTNPKGKKLVQSNATKTTSGAAANSKNKAYKVNKATFPVNINGRAIQNAKEPYPLLAMGGITYFPLTWQFAHDEFDWSLAWSEQKGLSIVTPQVKYFSHLIFDDKDSLYAAAANYQDIYKISKSLDRLPTLLTSKEGEQLTKMRLDKENKETGKAWNEGAIEAAQLERRGELLYYQGVELFSLKPYIEENESYYINDPKEINQGIEVRGTVYPLSEHKALVAITIYIGLYIPAPYTPNSHVLLLVNVGKAAVIPGYDQAPERIITNSDGSVWVMTEPLDEILASNHWRRGKTALIDSRGQSLMLHEKLGSEEIKVLSADDKGLLVKTISRFEIGGIDSKASEKDSIYRVSMDMKASKLYANVKGQAYVDQAGHIYVMDERTNGVTDLSRELNKVWWDYELAK
ncbi:hypothetical protein [Paenibacillus eucommiae]|uniref:Copper amine oxidase-like N-terminal domain-containing protein n=1 Tax=Paenibacillus eucommiae TaxID=1355755 RepID=A0ABS4IS40_9BACL|nr:hypothetical protein [Paenibacillus eucommiae]MBP1990343.1 hypothetical protein [Paenibacillus eucommiae]